MVHNYDNKMDNRVTGLFNKLLEEKKMELLKALDGDDDEMKRLLREAIANERL